jgi:hypothetical protein
MTATKTILDIRGKQLKLETAADVAPFTTGVDPTTLTAIYLGGNSIGVEAAKEFGRFLETADVLQVRAIMPEIQTQGSSPTDLCTACRLGRYLHGTHNRGDPCCYKSTPRSTLTQDLPSRDKPQ